MKINIENRIALSIFAAYALAVLVIFLPEFLGGVDSPQHAAQITTINHLLFNVTSPLSEAFTIDYKTPYLIVYFITATLSQITGVDLAMKLMVSATLGLSVIFLYKIGNETNRDLRVVPLFVPILLGFQYEWGFYSFMCSNWLGFATFYLAIKIIKSKTIQHQQLALMWVCSFLLILSHAFVFLITSLALLILTLSTFNSKTLKRALHCSLPFILCGTMALFWSRNIMSTSIEFNDMETQWIFSFTELMHVVGSLNGSTVFTMGCISGLAILFIPTYRGTGFIGCQYQLIKPAIYSAIFLILLIPNHTFGTWHIKDRVLFLIPLLLLYINNRNASKSSQLVPLLVFLSTTLSLALHLHDSYRLRYEQKQFSQLIGNIPNGARLLFTVSDYTPLMSQLNGKTSLEGINWFALHQAKGRGVVDVNFAQFSVQPTKYRDELNPLIAESLPREGGGARIASIFHDTSYNVVNYDYILEYDTVNANPVTLTERYSVLQMSLLKSTNGFHLWRIDG
ncbi:membrane hypothetical protein [Vibrio chagasii]|nr:membrane hypothetical protein [Vibrio chagasii]